MNVANLVGDREGISFRDYCYCYFDFCLITMGDVYRLEKCIGYVFFFGNFIESVRNENFDGDNFSIKSIVMRCKALLIRIFMNIQNNAKIFAIGDTISSI